MEVGIRYSDPFSSVRDIEKPIEIILSFAEIT
jgi:hypothetical protein